jgi:hypothetical protein
MRQAEEERDDAMRVNVYNEELTNEIEIVSAAPDTGETFVGIRFMLESSEKLHNEPGDDDRSAITIWAKTPKRAAELLHTALASLEAWEYREWRKAEPGRTARIRYVNEEQMTPGRVGAREIARRQEERIR